MTSAELRKGRVCQVGTVYALTTVTQHRARWFTSPDQASAVIEALRTVERAGRTCSLAWVIMPDHLHWLMQLRAGSLAGAMQILKSRSSRSMRRSVGHGRIWQAGYYDHALRNGEDLRKHARYIIDNPIRAGLTQVTGEYPFAWCRWQW